MPRHNTNTKPETRDWRTETGDQTKNLAHTERNVRLLRHMYYVMWLANGTLVASAGLIFIDSYYIPLIKEPNLRPSHIQECPNQVHELNLKTGNLLAL